MPLLPVNVIVGNVPPTHEPNDDAVNVAVGNGLTTTVAVVACPLILVFKQPELTDTKVYTYVPATAVDTGNVTPLPDVVVTYCTSEGVPPSKVMV